MNGGEIALEPEQVMTIINAAQPPFCCLEVASGTLDPISFSN